jgi:hypothetical protein
MIFENEERNTFGIRLVNDLEFMKLVDAMFRLEIKLFYSVGDL